MSNKSDKSKQEELRRQQEQLNAEALKDRAAVREPTELEKTQSDEALNWFKFLKDPNRDFSKAPMPFDIGAEEGAAGAEEERTALGAMQFGAAGADPNLQAVLKANIQERRAQRRGQTLEGAIARYDEMMRGLGGDVANRDLSRRQGLAGTTTSASGNATNSWAQFQPRPHWGLSLATAGIGAAGSALTGGLSSGGAFGSDVRLKDEIRRLDDVSAVAFEWNDAAKVLGFEPGTKAVGLLADEVERALPEFSATLPEGYKAINYMGLCAYLLELVKQLNQERKAATA